MVLPPARCFRAELDLEEIIALFLVAHIRNVCFTGTHTVLSWLAGPWAADLNSAPLPCSGCAITCASLGSYTSCLWCCLGHPQPPPALGARVYCGCKPGPTRVALHPGRMVEKPERQPYVRWTTCYDFEEMGNMDLSPYKTKRPNLLQNKQDRLQPKKTQNPLPKQKTHRKNNVRKKNFHKKIAKKKAKPLAKKAGKKKKPCKK